MEIRKYLKGRLKEVRRLREAQEIMYEYYIRCNRCPPLIPNASAAVECAAKSLKGFRTHEQMIVEWLEELESQ